MYPSLNIIGTYVLLVEEFENNQTLKIEFQLNHWVPYFRTYIISLLWSEFIQN